jgi:DNA-binding transcriptional regulator GbsR (MarR family)
VLMAMFLSKFFLTIDDIAKTLNLSKGHAVSVALRT